MGGKEQESRCDHALGGLCLCYFGFLRDGEITVPTEAAYDPGEHLNFVVSDPNLLKVTIKH